MSTLTTLLRLGSKGLEVELLQALLNQNGYKLVVDGDFGPATDGAVRDFQQKNGLVADGIVGNMTFERLKGKRPKPDSPLEVPGLAVTDLLLPDDQYVKSITPKRTIILHHTAGSHRPDFSIQGWAKDAQGRVATAYVIGGASTDGADTSFDGKVYRAFADKYWAYSLGVSAPNFKELEAQSVALELCNWGFVIRTPQGKFLNYVNREVPAQQVYELEKPFRGHKFYHKYTDKQLEATRKLVLALAEKYNISIKGPYTEKWFELSNRALAGAPGLWNHTNFRADKTDLHPQPELIQMLNSL